MGSVILYWMQRCGKPHPCLVEAEAHPHVEVGEHEQGQQEEHHRGQLVQGVILQWSNIWGVDEWTIRTPNPIFRLFFEIDLLTDFAALYLTDFIDWRYIHSWLVFSTQLVSCCPHGWKNYTCVLLPLYLLSDLPPPPILNVQYIHTVCGCGGGVGWVLSCVVNHILQEFYTLFLTRFRTYKMASPLQTKMTSKDNI